MKQSPTLVLLPGLDGTDVFLRPLLEQLPDSIRRVVVCYPQSGPNGYEQLLPIARRAIAELDDVVVMGSSFAGPLAVMLAAAEPAKVRGLILSATFLRAPRRRWRRFRFVAVGPVIWALRVTRRVPIWTLRSRHDPLRRAKAETWSRVSARCLAARVRALLAVDVRETLRRCEQPLLCVAFNEDDVVPPTATTEILLHRPSAKLVTLPGGHLAMHADARGLAREIVRFIREEGST